MKLMVNDLIHGDIKEVASIDFINGSALLWIKRGSTRVTVQRWLDDIELIEQASIKDEEIKKWFERLESKIFFLDITQVAGIPNILVCIKKEDLESLKKELLNETD